MANQPLTEEDARLLADLIEPVVNYPAGCPPTAQYDEEDGAWFVGWADAGTYRPRVLDHAPGVLADVLEVFAQLDRGELVRKIEARHG